MLRLVVGALKIKIVKIVKNKDSNKVCVGGCGHTVAGGTTCKTCTKALHLGCSVKHLCIFRDGNAQSSSQENLFGVIKDIQTSMQTINKKIDEQDKKFNCVEDMLIEIKKLREENSNLKTTVNALSVKLNALKSTAGSCNGRDAVFDVMDEIEQRRSREANLILFDVPESRGANVQQRVSDDKNMVLSGLGVIKPDLSILSCSWLGRVKDDGLPRPVKIKLSSINDVKIILKEK